MAKKAKRARSKTDKVVYSGSGKYLKTKIREYKKNCLYLSSLVGGDVLEDFSLFEKAITVATGNGCLPAEYSKKVARADFFTTGALIHGRNTSIYVKTPYLLDFLTNSKVKESDSDAVVNSVHTYYNLLKDGIFIHVPNKKESVFFVASEISDTFGIADMAYELSAARGDSVFYTSVFPAKKNWLKFDTREDGDVEVWNLVLNLLLYMDCFKECVIDGVPDIICKGDEAKRKKTITLHKDIEEVSRQAQITPHMRRGHFRFLQSDRYVNAKGKTVFVKPTMVKGKAKTVIEY
jgi:hypothetical protein